MPIIIKGIQDIIDGFNAFKFTGPRIQTRLLRLIGEITVGYLKQVTPIDSGELAASWKILKQGKNYIEVGTHLIEQVEDLESGTQPHIIRPTRGQVLRFEIDGQEVFTTEVRHPGSKPRPFLDNVARTVHNQVINLLDQALAENHPYFVKLKGGQARQFQQVGRTSAGMQGGISFAGRSTLVRTGTGRRQLKRRLALRRRRGSRAKDTKKETTIKLG